MSYESWLIANYKNGLSKYLEPWLIPQDAFPQIEDIYLFRGRMVKRDGLDLLGTLPGGTSVMGLLTRFNSDGVQDLVAFNQTKAFRYNAGSSSFDDVSGATSWTGQNYDFFTSTNHEDGFFVTNYVDPVRYYLSGTTWTNYTPVVNGSGDTLQKCKLIVAYKGRLVALFTQEAGIEHQTRARWCQNGTPYVTAPTPSGVGVDADSWRDDIPGRGGYVDAPTNEPIVACGFVKDTLIVYFQRSTWRLRYTGNEVLPFTWDRVNNTLGAESQFSAVEFDEGVLAIGNTGIIVSNGVETKRIDDQQIPDLVFTIDNTRQGAKRVSGVRDFTRELVYWAYPNGGDDLSYPNKVLCYNYKENAWSVFNQEVTTFGQFLGVNDLTWSQAVFPWNEANFSWNSGSYQAGNEQVIAGDRHGNIFFYNMLNTDNDEPFNFNLWTKQFAFYVEQSGVSRLGYVDFYIEGTSAGQFTLEHYIDDNQIPVKTVTVSTVATGQRRWVRAFLGATGRFHTLRLYLSDEQMEDELIATSPFILHGMILYTRQVGKYQ